MNIEAYKTLLNNTPNILRPIIRILVNAGLDFKAFTKITKGIFIDIAQEDKGFNNKKRNLSRIAIHTGLEREYIKKTIIEKEEAASPDTNIMKNQKQLAMVCVDLLHAWYVKPDYQHNEQPIDLSLQINEPNSFERLAKEFGGGIASSILLDELIKTKSVKLLDNNKIKVLSRPYKPVSKTPEHMLQISQAVSDFSDTFYHNLIRSESEASRFEGRSYSDLISSKNIPLFQKFIEKEAYEFLVKVDNWLTEHEEPENTTEETKRVGLGMYLINSIL